MYTEKEMHAQVSYDFRLANVIQELLRDLDRAVASFHDPRLKWKLEL